ncbi:MAG: UbiX family flavin prenyltransferase [Nitrospirota bacterium]|nr:UbiX family flavin prenyltransferase [Nitrospirota bacterium]
MGIYTIAITGASGSAYGVRLLQYFLKNRHKVFLIITNEGSLILKEEVGYDWSGSGKGVEKKIKKDLKIEKGSLSLLSEDNLCAPISSGSAQVDAMIIIPCSMKTLSGIAHGYANNLVERSADVMIKEGRPLILVPRETPLNSIHLKNMLTLSEMGIKIIPPMPAFYSHPQSIEDIVDFIVGKVLDSMQIENNLYKRWGTK